MKTGNKGGPMREERRKVRQTRRSADKVVNREGKLLMDRIKERKWIILNGSYDRKGGWTYVRELGTSVMDYVIANEGIY